MGVKKINLSNPKSSPETKMFTLFAVRMSEVEQPIVETPVHDDILHRGNKTSEIGKSMRRKSFYL